MEVNNTISTHLRRKLNGRSPGPEHHEPEPGRFEPCLVGERPDEALSVGVLADEDVAACRAIGDAGVTLELASVTRYVERGVLIEERE